MEFHVPYFTRNSEIRAVRLRLILRLACGVGVAEQVSICSQVGNVTIKVDMVAQALWKVTSWLN